MVDEPGGSEPGGDPFDRLEQDMVVALDARDDEAGPHDDRADLVDGPGIAEAGDAASEPSEIGVESGGVEPHVGDADAAARSDSSGELGRGGVLVGEGAPTPAYGSTVTPRQKATWPAIRRPRGQGAS